MKKTTLPSRNSTNRSAMRTFLLIPLVLACFGLAPQAEAVCQQGCLTRENTVLGDDALVSNTTGDNNTAIGFNALSDNTTGNYNTAVGNKALFFNTTGYRNTAIGLWALYSNGIGGNNTVIGTDAMFWNTTGKGNTATGSGALNRNAGGGNNTANGWNALNSNTTGSFNIALGEYAGFNLTTGSNNIAIGNRGVAGESSTIRIGRQETQTATFIAGISGVTIANGVGVIVNPQGQLGTVICSERFKNKIKPMDKASETIHSLRPVTFRYKEELDPDGIPQFGLVAEDVEKVNPDLVARDEQGKPYTVRYEAVNAMLLNEFLKEHGKVEKLKASVARQQKQIEALTAGLQKVSAQIELSKRAPQIVLNDQ